MKRKPQIIIGIILIVIFVLLAVAAPLLAPNDPNATDLALKNASKSLKITNKLLSEVDIIRPEDWQWWLQRLWCHR